MDSRQRRKEARMFKMKRENFKDIIIEINNFLTSPCPGIIGKDMEGCIIKYPDRFVTKEIAGIHMTKSKAIDFLKSLKAEVPKVNWDCEKIYQIDEDKQIECQM